MLGMVEVELSVSQKKNGLILRDGEEYREK